MSEGTIGMMEGAFFVPKSEILSWVNNLLQLNLTKIEQLGTGAAYCQIADVLFPGSLKLSRINWKARNEWEFIVNLKILQQAFQKSGVSKHIEIEKLAKAKYQDNLEFAQWLKRFFDLSNGPNLAKDYDAVGRRANQETEFGFLELRDNSRMAAMRQGRNDESADSKSYKWKIGARSKSPAVRQQQPLRSKGSQEKRKEESKQLILQNERDGLLARFNDIQAILENKTISESEKLKSIATITQAATANIRVNAQKRHSIDVLNQHAVIQEEESPPRHDNVGNSHNTSNITVNSGTAKDQQQLKKPLHQGSKILPDNTSPNSSMLHEDGKIEKQFVASKKLEGKDNNITATIATAVTKKQLISRPNKHTEKNKP